MKYWIVLAVLIAGCGRSEDQANTDHPLYEKKVYPPGEGAGHPGAVITDGKGTTIEILDVKVEPYTFKD